MAEAFGLTLRVALDGAVAWALASLLLRRHGARRLLAPLAAALALGLAVGAGAFVAAHARGLALTDLAPSLRRVTHLVGAALLAASFLLRGQPGARLFSAPLRPLSESALLAGALLFLLPQGVHLASLLRDAAIARGTAAPVLAWAALGALAAAAAGLLLAAAWRRAGFDLAVTPASLLALLFAVALAGVGPTALGAHTLPAALSGAIARAIHDGVHLAFVTFQVPDHPFLSDAAYQAILFAFDPRTHALATLTVLGAPLLLSALAFQRRPRPDAPPDARPPARRVLLAAFRREGRAVATSFALALLVLAGVVRAEGARADALYDPLPEPAADDGAGSVIVPLASPLGGRDARMRKFVYSGDGRAVTFFVVRRGDGALTAALDLCEICQPKGYAQMGAGYVFCKYCKTPIPVGTVGQPGGCNPIPIPGVELKGSLLVIPRATLLATWEKGMADKR
jgi:hypothetical protein